ncbi:MAG: hypothetical protein AB8A37_03275 [Prochlorococcus sp.]
MRLLSCQLQNIRLHRDLALEFSPRITLIGGTNETGKSTLVEALHRGLFLRASASGAPVEALRSRLSLGQPTVQVNFEAKGDKWLLHKRFSGTTGQVTLRSEASGKQLSGDDAEDLLAQLVGVKKSLGSKQASSVLPTRWAHLWVMQGSAGNNLLDAGKASYDFDALVEQLEHGGGTVVQQSIHDQYVAKQINTAIEENFTTRGLKKNSALWLREQKLNTAKSELEQAEAKLLAYEQASEELVEINEQLEKLQNKDLPALQERKKRIAISTEELSKLEIAIKLASKELEPIRLRRKGLGKAMQDIDNLKVEVKNREQRQSQLQKDEAEAESKEQALAQELQSKQTARQQLAAQKQQLDKRNQLLQALSEQARTGEAIAKLNKRKTLTAQLSKLAPIGREQLQQLRDLQQLLLDARTRQQAMTTGVKVLRTDKQIRVDNEVLEAGDQRQFSETFEVLIGDGVALQISSGGHEALDDLQRKFQMAQQNLNSALSSLKVTSLKVAEQRYEQRILLTQQLEAIGASPLRANEDLNERLDSLTKRSCELKKRLMDLSESREEMEQKQQLPTSTSELTELQDHLALTTNQTAQTLSQAESELEDTRCIIEQFKTSRIEKTSELKTLKEQQKYQNKKLGELFEDHGNQETLALQLTNLEKQIINGEQQLVELNKLKESMTNDDRDADLTSIDNQISRAKEQLNQLITQNGAAKQRCDSISIENPYAAVEQARVQLETTNNDYQNIKRISDGHKLLQQLFLDAQADLSSRYTEPLAKAIGSYLRPLVPEGNIVQLKYDQSTGFSGLQLKRGENFFNFDQLSGGMREQLTAALRLAMADVLKEGHDGSLPLIFDDAFTNSDPERISIVKQMLNTAANRGLQVILLSHDPSAYGSLVDHVTQLRAM